MNETQINSFEQTLPVSQKLGKVYNWMFIGLAATSATAYFAYSTGLWVELLGLRLFLILATFGLVWFISARIDTLSIPALITSFLVYSVLNGLTFSGILARYQPDSIYSMFTLTAVVFGAMSLIGRFSKRDLSGVASFMYMGLIGVIVASLFNLFIGSEPLSLTISILCVLIFSGLTAWETQSMKETLAQNLDEETEKRLYIFFALSLYLNFINIFLSLLRIFGNRR